jgi:hypothetical protein
VPSSAARPLFQPNLIGALNVVLDDREARGQRLVSDRQRSFVALQRRARAVAQDDIDCSAGLQTSAGCIFDCT